MHLFKCKIAINCVLASLWTSVSITFIDKLIKFATMNGIFSLVKTYYITLHAKNKYKLHSSLFPPNYCLIKESINIENSQICCKVP